MLSKVEIATLIYSTVKDVSPNGAPSGPLYAALMGAGVDFETYNEVVLKLISNGYLRQSNHQLFITGKTHQLFM